MPSIVEICELCWHKASIKALQPFWDQSCSFYATSLGEKNSSDISDNLENSKNDDDELEINFLCCCGIVMLLWYCDVVVVL